MAIICGTDFSDWARSAQLAAASIAGKLNEELWLVHVLEPDVETMEAGARQKVMDLLQQRLAAEAAHLKPLTKAPVQTSVMAGKASAVVREFAHVKKASLIVVGSAGHGASALVKLGGTSERLSSANDIPVLVVRDGEPFSSWVTGQPFKVFVGLDESDSSASAVRWVEKLRQAAPIDVVLGRVYYADEAHHRYGVGGRRFSFTDPDPAVEALIERDLKRRVPHLSGKGEVFYRAKLGVGRVADHLLELAEAERCQLVVVGTHGRTGLARMWSVSSATMHLARMAVAVIPPDGKGAGALAAQPRLKRVLVTTDFSELGNSAVPWAFAVTDKGGEVYLAHVTLTDGIAGDLVEQYLPPSAGPQTRSKVEEEVAARLRALTPVDADERHVVVRTEVLRSSDAAKTIIEAAERLGVDAVVIASHGRSGLMRTMLGSVSEAVLRGSRRPVFVVR